MSTFNRIGVRRFLNTATLAMSAAALTACGSIRSIEDIPEYFENVVDNTSAPKEYITSIDLARIRLGMSQLQVKNRLGPPMLSGKNQDDRWEYVLKNGQGAKEEFTRYVVYFKDQKVVRLSPLSPASATVAEKSNMIVSPVAIIPVKPAASISEKTQSGRDSGLALGSDLGAASAINDMLNAWVAAWSAKDVQAYLNFYADTFEHGQRSREAWEKHRRERLSEAGHISVTVSDLLIEMQSEVLAKVRFKQEYKSNRSKDRGRKTLILSKTGDVWKIQKEDFQK